jgi:hypothetical protein
MADHKEPVEIDEYALVIFARHKDAETLRML